MQKGLIIIALFFGLFACEVGESVDSPELRVEVENRKIKQIHEPEILSRALEIGKRAITEMQLELEANKIKINDSISFCDMNIDSTLTNVGKEYNVFFKRVCFPQKDGGATIMENQLLDAYVYNQENSIESKENIQKVEDGYICVAPIFVRDMCPTCIEDKLIGMWSVSLKKKMVVLSISDDTWKDKKLRNPRTKE